MTEDPEFTPRGIDLERPNPARVYDWYLGGTANWAIDRELGQQAMRVFPLAAQVAIANREFLRRLVRYSVEQGVNQFVDLGSGVPTAGNVHEVADELDSDSRCVYVDNEPVAVAHSELLLERHGDPHRHAIVNADLREPDQVWEQVMRTGVLDPQRPICLLAIAVLHFIQSDAEVERTVRRYQELLPGGSYLGLSHITRDELDADLDAKVQAGVELYKQASTPVRTRTRDELRGFLNGFRLVEPGVTWVSHWHDGDRPAGTDEAHLGVFLGGLGRKP